MDFLKIFNCIRPRYIPLIAVIIPVAVLLVFWAAVPGGSFNRNENGDYTGYYLPVAQNIVDGRGITINGRPALDYPPGYSIMVAACLFTARVTGCSEELILRLSMVFFFALGALLIYIIAGKLWNPSGALLASTLWSCYPIVLWAARTPSTELPFSVFLYAAIACMLTGWSSPKRSIVFFITAGILCGISMLIRPIAIGLGVLFAVMILFGRMHRFRKKAVLALCLVAGNLLAVLPWELWIFSQTQQMVPLTRGRDSFSLFDGLTFAVWNPDPAAQRKGVAVPADVKNLMAELIEKYSYQVLSQTITSKEIFTIMSEKLKKQPVTVIKLMAIKTVRSWYGTNTNRFEIPLLLIQAMYAMFLVWAVILLWRKRPDYRFILIAGGVITGYFWGMTVCVLSIVRYMMPVLGMLVIFFPAIPQFCIDYRRNKHLQNIPAHV